MSKELSTEERAEIGEIIEHIREEGIKIGSKGWQDEWSMKIGKLGGQKAIQYSDLTAEIEYYMKNYDKPEIGDVVPSNLGLSVYLGISEPTLYKILSRLPDEEKQRFVKSMKDIKNTYKHKLKNKALKGEVKERMAMFLLNIDHGMVEQTQATLTVNGKLSLSSANNGDIANVIDVTPDATQDLLF